jgi:hypothetical protein
MMICHLVCTCAVLERDEDEALSLSFLARLEFEFLCPAVPILMSGGLLICSKGLCGPFPTFNCLAVYLMGNADQGSPYVFIHQHQHHPKSPGA